MWLNAVDSVRSILIILFKLMSNKLPPLRDLPHLKPKADLIPEIHFFGQIVGGQFVSEQALLCEMILQTGQYWQLIYPGKEKSYQTQTTYADVNKNIARKDNSLFGHIPSIYISKSTNFQDGMNYIIKAKSNIKSLAI